MFLNVTVITSEENRKILINTARIAEIESATVPDAFPHAGTPCTKITLRGSKEAYPVNMYVLESFPHFERILTGKVV